MLDVAPTELLVVAVVAVVVIGPRDLPKAMRVAGYWVGKMRGVARQFRQGFDDMVREAEFAEMEKKWADENARIMREFPSPDTPPTPALSSPPAALPPPADEIERDADAEARLTVQPALFDDPAFADPAPAGRDVGAPPKPRKPRVARNAATSPERRTWKPKT